LSGTVRYFMTCINFFWNHILASTQQMCENHLLIKLKKEYWTVLYYCQFGKVL
jgi:hypothetical protein